MKKKKDNRGGARENSGRKKGEPTKTKRIPVAIESDVDDLIAEHKKNL